MCNVYVVCACERERCQAQCQARVFFLLLVLTDQQEILKTQANEKSHSAHRKLPPWMSLGKWKGQNLCKNKHILTTVKIYLNIFMALKEKKTFF